MNPMPEQKQNGYETFGIFFLLLSILTILVLTFFVKFTSAQTASTTPTIDFSYAYAPIEKGVDVNILLQKKLDYIIDQLSLCRKK